MIRKRYRQQLQQVQGNLPAELGLIAESLPTFAEMDALAEKWIDKLANGASQSIYGTKMTINSMLRTVAQQYLLYHWYQAGQCSISLAATPGTSTCTSMRSNSGPEIFDW